MFSFTKIASFAILALGTLASVSALPAAKEVAPVVVAAPVIVPKTVLQERDGNTVATIFASLNVQLGPVLSGLSGATDAATVQSGVTQVTSLIQSATTSLSGLVGQPQAQVLVKLDGSGLLSVGDVAGLVGGLLNTVFGVLGPLTSGSGVVGTLGLLTPLLSVVETLLSVVVTLLGTTVASLLSALLPLILGLVPQLLSLVISLLLGLLGL